MQTDTRTDRHDEANTSIFIYVNLVADALKMTSSLLMLILKKFFNYSTPYTPIQKWKTDVTVTII
jgi:hypothetical protein